MKPTAGTLTLQNCGEFVLTCTYPGLRKQDTCQSGNEISPVILPGQNESGDHMCIPMKYSTSRPKNPPINLQPVPIDQSNWLHPHGVSPNPSDHRGEKPFSFPMFRGHTWARWC